MQNIIQVYAIVVIGLIIFLWSFRHVIVPFFQKKKLRTWLWRHENAKQLALAQQLFNQLYQDVSGRNISHAERRRLKLSQSEYIYGEVEFLSFVTILEKCNIHEDDIFYDLGCGAGKPTFIAALCFRFAKVCGIEILPGLYQTAAAQLRRLQHIITMDNAELTDIFAENVKAIQFINENILVEDFSDATVVFINATCFPPQLYDAVVRKLKNLRKGARIIISSKTLNLDNFAVIFQDDFLMSWGMNSVNAYVKVR